jgi:enterochelin esterase-like enzyme
MRHRLRALLPVAGVLVLTLAVTASPDLIQLLRRGPADPRITPAGTLLAGPNSPGRPGSGRIVRDTFYSLAMKDTRVFDVYLPPSYDLVQAQHRAYPVLYLLHGDNGSVDDWAAMGLRGIMDSRGAQGSLPELLVVMPDGSSPTNDETDWANRWDGTEAVEDQLVELVGQVDGTYRTLADRSFRFIGGLSSGGFGALNIALHHAELFSVTMSFSGFASAADPAVDPGVFGTNPAYIARNSPAVQVQTVPEAADLYYVLSAGNHDLYFQARMRDFAAELASLSYPNEFHVVDGGHDGQAWAAGLGFGLDYLGRELRRHPEPTPPRQ